RPRVRRRGGSRGRGGAHDVRAATRAPYRRDRRSAPGRLTPPDPLRPGQPGVLQRLAQVAELRYRGPAGPTGSAGPVTAAERDRGDQGGAGKQPERRAAQRDQDARRAEKVSGAVISWASTLPAK